MATLATNYPTLVDWATRRDPNGPIQAIAEVLSAMNPILEDMTFVEANQQTTHRTTIRTGLPDTAWRMLNYGVQPSKSTTVQVDDAVGWLEGLSVIDERLLELTADAAAFRLSEDVAFLESMAQTMATTVFYGNQTLNPERFTGLAPRYNDNTTAAIKENILSGGGSGSDNTSIWLIGWGPMSCHGIFSKGSKAGFQRTDMGVELVTDSSGRTPAGQFRALRTHYRWDAGLSLRDWRYVVRIANIDVSDLIANSGSQALLFNLMVQAISKLPSLNLVRPVFYCNRTVATMLDIQAMNRTNVNFFAGNEEGQRKLTFRGVPIKTCDAILNTEATVS